jgi:periplasmic protein TonB
MKHKFLILLFLLVFANIKSQENKHYTVRTKTKENTLNPEFYGGLSAFYKYISDNLAFGHVNENVSEIITMRFTIDTDGKVTDIKTIKDSKKTFLKFGKQLHKVLKKSPKWTPGKVRDIVADVTLEIDIPIYIKFGLYIDG